MESSLYEKPDEWHYSCGRGHRRLLSFMEYIEHKRQMHSWLRILIFGVTRTTIHHSIRATLAFWGQVIKCSFHANATYATGTLDKVQAIRNPKNESYIFVGLVFERKSDSNRMNLIQLDHWNINFRFIFFFYSPEKAFVRP